MTGWPRGEWLPEFWSSWHSPDLVADCPCSRITWGPFPCCLSGSGSAPHHRFLGNGDRLYPRGAQGISASTSFLIFSSSFHCIRSKMELTLSLKLSISSYRTTIGVSVGPTNTLILDICPQGFRGNVCSLFYPFPQNTLPWWCHEETYKSKQAAGRLRDAEWLLKPRSLGITNAHHRPRLQPHQLSWPAHYFAFFFVYIA